MDAVCQAFLPPLQAQETAEEIGQSVTHLPHTSLSLSLSSTLSLSLSLPLSLSLSLSHTRTYTLTLLLTHSLSLSPLSLPPPSVRSCSQLYSLSPQNLTNRVAIVALAPTTSPQRGNPPLLPGVMTAMTAMTRPNRSSIMTKSQSTLDNSRKAPRKEAENMGRSLSSLRRSFTSPSTP